MRAGVRPQWLRMGTALAEDLSLLNSIYDRLFTSACNFISRNPMSFYDLYRRLYLYTHIPHRYT